MSARSRKRIDWFAVAYSVCLALTLAVVFDFSPTIRVSNTLHNEFDANFTYFDLAAFLLGAVGLAVAALGVICAVLAFWGYEQIKKASIQAAIDAASKTAFDHVKSSISEQDGELYKFAKKEIQEIVNKQLGVTGLSTQIFEEAETEDAGHE